MPNSRELLWKARSYWFKKLGLLHSNARSAAPKPSQSSAEILTEQQLSNATLQASKKQRGMY